MCRECYQHIVDFYPPPLNEKLQKKGETAGNHASRSGNNPLGSQRAEDTTVRIQSNESLWVFKAHSQTARITN